MINTKSRYPLYSIQLKKRLLEDNNQRMLQNSQMSNESADNENANNEVGIPNKRSSGGGDAYTKMVTKVEKIKVCRNILDPTGPECYVR